MRVTPVSPLQKEKRMKWENLIGLLLASGAGFAVALFVVGTKPAVQPLTGSQAQSDSPTTGEMLVQPSREEVVRARTSVGSVVDSPAETTALPARRTPEELLNELAAIQVTTGPMQGRAQYRIMSLLEQLSQYGESALPALRQFLMSGRDVSYQSAGNRQRNNSSNLLPPSLRFALFDVVREIGGAGAEALLVESLNSTGQGAELAYLVQLLEMQSPGKHRDAAILAAKNLLASGKLTDSNDRNSVYEVLRQFNDTSFVAVAQANLIQSDGTVDRAALRYLLQTQGKESLAIAAQMFQDKRVVDANSKESLGRIALAYVGADEKAAELYHAAIHDPVVTPDQRRNLIEDLNQDGLSNRRNPTAEDLKTILSRYNLAEAYLQQPYVQNDPVATAAFKEARKDLAQMLQRAGSSVPTVAPVK